MIVTCPDCSSKAKLRDELAGKTVSCPRCNAQFMAVGASQTWYYATGSEKVGPLSQEEFDELVDDGTIGQETLVWKKGMAEWQALDQVGPAVEVKNKWYYASGDEKLGPLAQQQFDRAITGGVIGGDTLVWRKGMSSWQPLSEIQAGKVVVQNKGGPKLKYAGWGGRSIAKVIDMIFMLALAGMVEGLSRKLFPEAYATPETFNPIFVVTLVLNMLLGVFYITWFVGKFGATPGKMVVKIKVVNPSGGKVGYGQAFGRYCAEFIVVFLTVMLGYLFGLFDSQKRTLHDRLANTRVIAV